MMVSKLLIYMDNSLKEKVLIAAMIDGLTHKVYLADMIAVIKFVFLQSKIFIILTYE